MLDARIATSLEAWSEGTLTAAESEALATALDDPQQYADARADRILDVILRAEVAPNAGAAAARRVLAAIPPDALSKVARPKVRSAPTPVPRRWPIFFADTTLATAAGLALLLWPPAPRLLQPGEYRFPAGDVVEVKRGMLRLDTADQWRLNEGLITIAAGARPPAAPLLILAPEAQITVIGTRFTIECTSSATAVTVSEGTVSCRARDVERSVGPGGLWTFADGRMRHEQETSLLTYDFAGEDITGFSGHPVPLSGPDGLRCLPGVLISAEWGDWGVYLSNFGAQLATLSGGERIRFRLWLAAGAPSPLLRIDSAGDLNMYGLTIDPPRDRWVDFDIPLTDLLPMREAIGSPKAGSRLWEISLLMPAASKPRLYLAQLELIRRQEVP